MKNNKITVEKLFTDYPKLIEYLNVESDIGCVLISLNFVEKCLEILLKNKFIPNSITANELFIPSKGFLGNYINKVKLSYCLRLIDKEKFKDLSKLAEIRNLFAHEHTLLSFSSPIIIKKCEELEFWKKSLPPYFEDIQKAKNLHNGNEIAKIKFVNVILNLVGDFLSLSFLSDYLRTND